MEEAYDQEANTIGLSCIGCPDNCCNSYFQHHTYIEWAYLWQGIRSHPGPKQQQFVDKAGEYVAKSEAALAQGVKPRIMCPLNDNGICQLYEHRLMICRMHGVPNSLVMPDGRRIHFPGCFRCQELCSDREEVHFLDRTGFYRELASLEIAFAKSGSKALPRVSLTIAEMIVKGPPKTL